MGQPDPRGQPGNSYQQYNTPTAGGTVYSHQGTGNQVVYNAYTDPAAERRRRLTTRLLIGAIVADVLYFFYGMWSYTGQNTTGDTVRAVVYLVMLGVTIRLIRNWVRQRV
jgi:hypothetical protein